MKGYAESGQAQAEQIFVSGCDTNHKAISSLVLLESECFITCSTKVYISFNFLLSGSFFF